MDSEEGNLGLDWSLDQLWQWEEEWEKQFKCKALYFGKTSQGRTCTWNGRALLGVVE